MSVTERQSDVEKAGALYSSNHGAALLLLTVRTIASFEVKSEMDGPLVQPDMVPSGESEKDTILKEAFPSPTDEAPQEPRCRTVSIGSLDLNQRPRQAPPVSSKIISMPSSPRPESPGGKILLGTRSPSSVVPSGISVDKNFVCTQIEGPVRGVLRKKFNWKAFPELEAYLVENRERYLEYSSALNYTSEQKRYNNRLTQGLLDLAADCGYVFDSFTFAAVRDRIRCYYKSYVQAVKKMKRKKKRR